MWYLKSEHDGARFYLLTGKTHKINRKGGDLVLVEDLSISRNHSAMLVSQEEVFLWDEGSKYGTFIYNGSEEQKLPQLEKTKLKVGDRMRFGVQWHIFTLCKTDIVVSTSTIPVEEKKVLQKILSNIGGKISTNWTEQCTHLTMNQVSLTHKVVFALAAGKPIVTVEFWQKMEEAVRDHIELPKIKNYQPPIEEEELQKQTEPNTLLPSENRMTLFKGKVFVFSSEDKKNKLKPLVECAGGVCKSVESSKLSPQDCCDPNYVVIKDGDTSVKTIRAALKQKGLRDIDISEIGLAIYNNSLTRYCNPSWSKPIILGRSPSQSQGICLVENTEDILSNTKEKKIKPHADIVIPPSLSSVASDTSIDNSRSVKRPSSPTDDRPTKRPNQEKKSQKQGSLQSWLQRSQRSSEATCSFDTSVDYMSGLPSPKSQNKKLIPENSTSDDGDPFKLSSPKMNMGIKRGRTAEEDVFKVPSPKKPTAKKRERIESDPLELPSPKRGNAKAKAAPSDQSFDPFEESIEEHSDEEMEVSRSSRKKTSKVSSPRIEDDSDDEFQVPAPRKKASRRISSDDDEPTNKTAAASAKKSFQEERPCTSLSSEERRTNKGGKPVGDGLRMSNGSTRSNAFEIRKDTSHAPIFSDFIDKSNGVAIKKEESYDEEHEQDLAQCLNKIRIGETSLYRQRPPLSVRTNSTSVIDGKPNFKRFRMVTRQIHRRVIDLVVDQSLRLYSGVPEPDPDIPADIDTRSREAEDESSEDLFPSTSARVQENRQVRRNRPENQIVDEWTVP